MTTNQELSRIKLFKGLSDRELQLLAPSLTHCTKRRGEYLFQVNDAGHSCYVILSGTIEVLLMNEEGNTEPVAQLEPGETVGHLALVDRRKRSAACRVGSDQAVLAELRSDDFERLFNAQTPFAYKILDNLVVDLVSRLRHTNETLLQASVDRKEQLDHRSKRAIASQLLGGATADDDWNPDKIEVLGMSLKNRIKRKD